METSAPTAFKCIPWIKKDPVQQHFPYAGTAEKHCHLPSALWPKRQSFQLSFQLSWLFETGVACFCMFLHVVPHCSCLQVVQVWSVEHIKDSELFAQLLSLRIALRIGGPETKLPLIMVNSYQAV